ncbi:unnamed protein product [Staurois parvus]|uniref:Ribosomal protein L20 n=1 Tax=Staurois parvus TaxID=386267 RepID=A0ABN9D8M2_9NEOB|nr:unnamed protein product [Staurois parvus]
MQRMWLQNNVQEKNKTMYPFFFFKHYLRKRSTHNICRKTVHKLFRKNRATKTLIMQVRRHPLAYSSQWNLSFHIHQVQTK